MTFNRKLRVYLANAYSSKLADPDAAALQRAQRRQLESFIAGKLKKQYDITVIPPIAVSGAMADLCQFGTGFDSWADDDFNFIDMVDEVWVQVSDGWDTSIGVQAEIKFAIDIGKPVKYININTLELFDTATDAIIGDIIHGSRETSVK